MNTATIKGKNILVLVKGSNVTRRVMDAGGMSLAGQWEYLIIWGRWGISQWGKLEKGEGRADKKKKSRNEGEREKKERYLEIGEK